MKKLSLILAGAVLFGSFAFANPAVKHVSKAPIAKQTAKPAAKPAAKPTNPPVKPAAKPAVKPATKPTAKPVAKPAVHTHKGAPVKKAVK